MPKVIKVTEEVQADVIKLIRQGLTIGNKNAGDTSVKTDIERVDFFLNYEEKAKKAAFVVKIVDKNKHIFLPNIAIF